MKHSLFTKTTIIISLFIFYMIMGLNSCANKAKEEEKEKTTKVDTQTREKINKEYDKILEGHYISDKEINDLIQKYDLGLAYFLGRMGYYSGEHKKALASYLNDTVRDGQTKAQFDLTGKKLEQATKVVNSIQASMMKNQ